MNGIFQFVMHKFVLIFFDDILIYRGELEKSSKHLEIGLITLHDNQLYAMYSKCSIGLQQIEYVGHIVSTEGDQIKKFKVEAILNWPKPKNLTQLRRLLELSRYYRRFISNYATRGHPVMNLLKKNYCQQSSTT